MATIKDVAALAGLNVSTVSRILNNRGYISLEAQEKVRRAMEQLNYQPNELARALSKRQTGMLGLLVPHIMHPYFARIISHVERAAFDERLKLLLCCSREDDEREQEYLELCKSNRVDGLIVCSGTVDIGKFTHLGFPVVALERKLGVNSASVECDNLHGGALAAEHLIKDCGCKNLIHFSGMRDIPMPADDRERGFAEVCRANGVRYRSYQVSREQYYALDYRALIRAALVENPDADGVFASSDVIAAQTIQIARALGLSVPDDLQLVGFDDTSTAQLVTPAITTVRQPVREMTRTAITLLKRLMNGEIAPTRAVLPVTLIKRESTRDRANA